MVPWPHLKQVPPAPSSYGIGQHREVHSPWQWVSLDESGLNTPLASVLGIMSDASSTLHPQTPREKNRANRSMLSQLGDTMVRIQFVPIETQGDYLSPNLALLGDKTSGSGKASGTPSLWSHWQSLEGVLTLTDLDQRVLVLKQAWHLTTLWLTCSFDTYLLSILLFCHEVLTKDQADTNSVPLNF